MYKNGSGSDDNPARNKMPDVVPIRSAGGGSDLASLSPSGSGTTRRYRNQPGHNYVHKRIRFQSHNVNPGHFPCSKKQQRPIQIRIGCGKSDPANWNLPDSGYSLAVMAQRGRTRNGPGMFTASISRYSPSRL